MATETPRPETTAGDTEKPASTENETQDKDDLIDTPEHSSLQKRSAEQTPEETPVETPAETPAEHEREYVHGIKLFAIMVPTTLVYFLLMLDGSIVSTAIPAITSEFNSLLDIGWYGSAYQLASSSFQPLSGKIYTYFSTKWSFLVFFFVFEVGSAVCGAAQSSTMFIVGRAIAGLGSSGLMNGALTMVAAILPPHRQPLVMGVNVGLGQVGIACGPLIGGAFTEYVSWRWCFYINLPIGAVVGLLLIMLRIPEATPKPPVRQILSTAVQSLDLQGFCLVAPAAIMFFLALQWGGNQYAWDSSTVIGLFVGAGATFILFLLWEHRRGDEAMMPFFMIRKRIIWSASGTMFFFMGVLFVANYYLPIYFQAVKDDSAVMSGVHILPTIIGQIIFAMSSGVFVEVLGYYLPWVLFGTAATSVGYGLLSMISPSTRVQDWVGYQIIFGVGCGAAATSSYIAIQNLVPAAQIPVAMAILIFCQNLGGAVFLIVAQTIFSNTLRDQIVQLVPDANAALIIAAGARSVRQVVSGEQLAGVLQAYSTSVDRVMYLGVAIGASAFAFACGLGWKDIRVEKRKRGREAQSNDADAPTLIV
ncbi:MFS general substrate transporter [Hypoxylon rubiginosum]|uniref:MFS general substrate transporter n=1 Tax=Hypoxylon rubiginosum TaxID=110542 RepID=A0ACB9Z7E9_9PEZI|nr:MFS general substrate transporter [Hypoxylon rubiginosum]